MVKKDWKKVILALVMVAASPLVGGLVGNGLLVAGTGYIIRRCWR